MNKVFLFALALGLAVCGSAQAAHFKVLKNFCERDNCLDGANPFSAPVADGAGNYFGTTVDGGAGGGTVYEMSPEGNRWRYQRIHYFCAKPSCGDGQSPFGRLIVDTKGNLYGMTSGGGRNGKGVVFELIRAGGEWRYKRLYDFCSRPSCADGMSPQYSGLTYQGAASGALYDGTSPLYGTTPLGGANNGGVIFTLTRDGHGWSESVVFDFCAFDQCTAGTGPANSVLVDASGHLFATTLDGGEHEDGTVVELTRNGSAWDETVLASFCAQSNCADGSFPASPLAMDGAGDLYGTTEGGGAHNQGSVFKLHPNGAGSTLTTLYSFCSQANCNDGSLPYAGVTIDAQGRLIGATLEGGTQSFGTLFMLSGKHLDKLTTLVSFAESATPGGQPYSAPVFDPSGAMFGTAWVGGSASAGVLYTFKP